LAVSCSASPLWFVIAVVAGCIGATMAWQWTELQRQRCETVRQIGEARSGQTKTPIAQRPGFRNQAV
jgi:hypothetical protein